MTDVHEMLSGFLCNYSLKCSGEVLNWMNIRLLMHCFSNNKVADDMKDYFISKTWNHQYITVQLSI